MQLLIFVVVVAAAVIGITWDIAVAQQPQQTTPSQTALKINSVIGSWAEALETQAKQIADLQKQLDEAKTKCEAPK